MQFAASRLAPAKPSASARVSQAAKAAKAAGDLGLGEPDFGPPAHIIEAAHKAALKQAAIDKLARENHLTHVLNEIIISNGAKQFPSAAMDRLSAAIDKLTLA